MPMKKLKHLKSLPPDAVYDVFNSPLGALTIIASTQNLHCILWETDREHAACEQILLHLKQKSQNKIIQKTKQQLSEYFQGIRKIFNLPYVLNGTDFQMHAWQQLLQIPYATTLSYGEQAARIGNKNKSRAVGFANGCNPISIIVPCHRVIGSNGKPVGFGGGLSIKSKLLHLEQTGLI